MTKILNKSILAALTTAMVGACSWFSSDENIRYESRYLVQPLVKNPTSVVVCRDKQCAPARLSMSREYIYNSLLQLLQNNKGLKALLCTADSASHTCTEEFLAKPLKVGITPARMYIDDVKITDAKVAKGEPKIDLVLNYNVTYNGQIPDCRPARTMAFVESVNSIMMEDSGYECKMTAVSNSTVRTMFAIDYIDLDYGYIGGYYSIGVSGPASGGGAGYMMFRLPVNAYPLSPALQGFENDKEKDIKAEEKKLEEEKKAEQEKEIAPVEASAEETAPVQAQAQAPAASSPADEGNTVPMPVLKEEPALAPVSFYTPQQDPYQPTLFEPVVAAPQPVPAGYQPVPVPVAAQQPLPAVQPAMMPQPIPSQAQPMPVATPAIMPQPAYGVQAALPANGQVIQVDICNGTPARIYPGAQVQELCNGVPVQVVPEPALRPEVMVEPQPDMSMRGPAAVNGKPVTKTVVEDLAEVRKAPTKVEIFPIYTKKSVNKKAEAKKAADTETIAEETAETSTDTEAAE